MYYYSIDTLYGFSFKQNNRCQRRYSSRARYCTSHIQCQTQRDKWCASISLFCVQFPLHILYAQIWYASSTAFVKITHLPAHLLIIWHTHPVVCEPRSSTLSTAINWASLETWNNWALVAWLALGLELHGCSSPWRRAGPIHSAFRGRVPLLFIIAVISHRDGVRLPPRRAKWTARRPRIKCVWS